MFVNIFQAARHLNVYTRQLGKWLDDGLIPATGTGNERKILVADLNKFCRDRGFSEYPNENECPIDEDATGPA